MGKRKGEMRKAKEEEESNQRGRRRRKTWVHCEGADSLWTFEHTSFQMTGVNTGSVRSQRL